MEKREVNDTMQKKYTYFLTEPIGQHFDSEFQPDLTPKEMLELGIFGGKYLCDCQEEFPSEWFENAKLSPEGKNPKLNFFGVDASLPLLDWQKKGWIHPADPRGWFQWYCRYFLGRRIPEEDARQIGRWKAVVARHRGAILKNCAKGDFTCRPRQRQALLHWACDTRKI